MDAAEHRPVLHDIPPSTCVFPPADAADEAGIVAVGGDLEPGTLLEAYCSGLFPMPFGLTSWIGWWSPDPRGVLPLDSLRVSRSLRRSCRRYEVNVDTAFEDVVDGCADPARPGGWITPQVRRAYVRLHELGWAHSVETWDPESGTMVGGLYGVAIGGLFAGESMFHTRTDASKVALVGLVQLLAEDGRGERFIDVQWSTPHLAGLGAVDVARSRYLAMLRDALTLPPPQAFAGGIRQL